MQLAPDWEFILTVVIFTFLALVIVYYYTRDK